MTLATPVAPVAPDAPPAVASRPAGAAPGVPLAVLHDRILTWYAAAARDLPWRRPECSPWGVFVSEVMLQQTPVARVEPAWREWLARWPTPAALAAETPGEAVRAWGRLGYPRRALRLHAAAAAMVADHGGAVPQAEEILRSLPGVGDYTAAAVAGFAFGRRTCVVDTNVRRVQARIVTGSALPAPTLTRAESALAGTLLPEAAEAAVTWNVAVMELGALVCTARVPRCGDCPVADVCAWRRAGHPPYDGKPHRGQAWAGTDRQARGALLAALRERPEPVPAGELAAAWPSDAPRRIRALASLIEDGLVEQLPDGRYALPS